MGVLTKKPNVFFLLTDDQDVMLGGLTPMKKLKSLLIEQGVTFSNAFVHTPICCPSRSSFLTGRYLHNSLTFENDIKHGCSNITWAEGPEKRTYAVQAKNSGYHTSYSGKYLNQYALPGSSGCIKRMDPGCFAHIPLGWDDWHGLMGNSRYYNGTISNNGVPKFHGDKPADYLPDIFFNHTYNFIKSHLKNESKLGIPFLAVLATPSCHGPFTPAPKYIGHFANSSAPITPNYNASTKDKQWLMRKQSPITEKLAQNINKVHNNRFETLLSVDDYVASIIDLLDTHGELENTYILFTSDHGFQLGQHRLLSDKRHLYEHDIRIPFIIRGPGVPKNQIVDTIVLNIDVAPTLTDIFSGTVPDDMDGRSFKKILTNIHDDSWRTNFMVDYHGQGKEPCGLVHCPAPPPDKFHLNDSYNNTYACVRTLDVGGNITTNSMYCEFEDAENFIEYYDHNSDPWQMINAWKTTPPETLDRLKKILEEFRKCKGKGCRSL